MRLRLPPLGRVQRDHSLRLGLPVVGRRSGEAGRTHGNGRRRQGDDFLSAAIPAWVRALGKPAVPPTWQGIVDGTGALPPGRALDVGCGTGRDAVYLATRGWQVTAVDISATAIARARQRAAQERAEVHWITGDVSRLGKLGLEPGYTLLYDLGCIQGLADPARMSTLQALTELAGRGDPSPDGLRAKTAGAASARDGRGGGRRARR